MSRYFSFPAVVLAVWLAGCQVLPEPSADPTRTYVLGVGGPAETATAKPAGHLVVGIRDVEVPGYLHNRRELAVRTAANEVRFQEFSRWAEPLEGGVDRVLSQSLLQAGNIGDVCHYPFSTEGKRDYDLVVRVVRCEGAVVDGAPVARFAASYEVLAAGVSDGVVLRRTFVAPDHPWDGHDFGVLAALLSQDVQRLAEDVAANLPK